MTSLALNALNYQHLLYFWVVAREGSIVRATALLHLTQPTISSQLKTLEASLGAPLFSRQGRGLVLTETGQLVFRYADEMFRAGQQLTEALTRGEGDIPSRLIVGISDSLPRLTTWTLLQPAIATSPGVRLTCRIDKLDRLLADLAVHALDVVLADSPASPSLPVRVFNHLLGECGVTAFGTPALAARFRRKFPQSINDAPFVLQTENTAIRRAFDAWCIANDIRPHIVCESEDSALLQVFGQEGMGLFLAPSVVEARIRKQHGVRVVGRLPSVRERFYAISVERRLAHPGVAALIASARKRVFQSRREASEV